MQIERHELNGLPSPVLWRFRGGGARSWMRIGAALGLIVGPTLSLTGCLVEMTLAVTRSTNPLLDSVSNALILCVAPFLLFGGYCLDRLEDCLASCQNEGANRDLTRRRKHAVAPRCLPFLGGRP
jgi:hypothetical protein